MTTPFWTDPPKDQAEFARRMSIVRNETQFTSGGADAIYSARLKARTQRRLAGVAPEEEDDAAPPLVESNVYARRRAERETRKV